MLCPNCQSNTRVVDSRASQGTTRRRRYCCNCQTRFSTYETLIETQHRIPPTPEEIAERKKRDARQRYARKKAALAAMTPEQKAELNYRRKLQRAGVPYPMQGARP